MARAVVMYLRFVGPEKHPHSEGYIGFYRFIRELDDDAVPVWLQAEFDQAWAVFCRLRVPDCLKRRSRHPRAARGQCWFKPEAVELIAAVRYLAWICTESGYPIREIRSRTPGMIFWEDDVQIVAVPFVGMRR